MRANWWQIPELWRRRRATGTTEPSAVHRLRSCICWRDHEMWTAPCPTASRTLGVVLMPERHITVQRRMAASTSAVWALFADFPHLASHWSGLRATRAIGNQTSGVGARRHVKLKPIGSMDETVTTWEEGRRIDTENHPSVSVPFNRAETTLTLEPDDEGTFHVRLSICTQGRPNRPIHRPIDRQDAHGDLHRDAGCHRRGRPRERWRPLTACF